MRMLMTRTIHNPILNVTVTFLKTASESDGAITELEATVMPGESNPPHFHRTYDETFTMLEGILRLELSGGVRVDLSPGTSYVVKAGQVHSFHNVSQATVRVQTQIVPGNEGFEHALRFLYGLASDGLYNQRMPRSLQHLAVCASIGDTWLPGLPSLFNPLIRVFALIARWRGIERQLLCKYCGAQ
jgi:quercetin dioxygenase-like cupin family protein